MPMRPTVLIATLFVVLAGWPAYCAEPPCCDAPGEGFLQRVHPVGGWAPYGGGLLRWWPTGCFPCSTAPDDYCRKPLPRICWPASPPCSTWVATDASKPQSTAPCTCTKSH
jgi:hypothetical protein